MKSFLRPLSLLTFVLVQHLLVSAACATDNGKAMPEYAMKAAYLYNFAQLTEWPVPPDGNQNETFTVCVFGQDEVVSALEKLLGRTINGKPLKILRINGVAEIKQCQLLYVGEGDSDRGGRLFQLLRGTPVLTVTDDPRAAHQGAMLQIVPDERRLAFEVNLQAANQSQLRLSSKLLNLARRVRLP